MAALDRSYYVYIMASGPRGTLYIGMTNDLRRRLYEHQTGLTPGFSSKYGTTTLVYFEQTPDVTAAINREKQLKKWKRIWKIELIEKTNPEWKNLSQEWE